MMKTALCTVVLAVSLCSVLLASAAPSRMPDFPCTFSVHLVEVTEFKTNSPLDRVNAVLLTAQNPQARLAAQEALQRAKNGEDISDFGIGDNDMVIYVIENQHVTLFSGGVSAYWNATGDCKMFSPFFDRFVCAKIHLEDPPIQCPSLQLNADMKFVDVEPCLNHPGEQCDVWEGSTAVGTERVLMVKDSNTLDVVFCNTTYYTYRGDYIGMNTTEPDHSHFVPPTDVPCSDYTVLPDSSSKQTWSRKKYPGKKFPLNPLSKTLFREQPLSSSGKTRSVPASRVAIPDSFDSRKYWPHCDTMKAIRDQGPTMNCWAFGAAESFGDRYCVATGDSITFSPQYLVGCYTESQTGMAGGAIDVTWITLMKKGIVSDKCRPYNPNVLNCSDTCDDHSPMKRFFAKSAYSPYVAFDVNETVRLIQQEIMTYGPVEAAMYTFSDFNEYSGGVYQRTVVGIGGGHAVKIIGWGVDESTKVPYWLVANSWGEDWGEKGFFRIRRGRNECDIETMVATGLIRN